MGELAAAVTATAAVKSLNGMFGEGLEETHELIKQLRNAGYDQLLKPIDGGTSDKVLKRRGSLRYAAWLMADRFDFDAQYPAANFRQFLRWLTWFGDPANHAVKKFRVTTVKASGNKQVEDSDDPASHVLKAMKKALPSAGDPKALNFKWTSTSSADPFALNIDYSDKDAIKIEVITVDATGLVDGDGEDDI